MLIIVILALIFYGVVMNYRYDNQKDIDDKNYLEEEICPYKLEPNKNCNQLEFDDQEEFD